VEKKFTTNKPENMSTISDGFRDSDSGKKVPFNYFRISSAEALSCISPCEAILKREKRRQDLLSDWIVREAWTKRNGV
jgi:hypothetical protein